MKTEKQKKIVNVLIEDYTLTALVLTSADHPIQRFYQTTSTASFSHPDNRLLSGCLQDIGHFDGHWVIGLGNNLMRCQSIRSQFKLPRQAGWYGFGRMLRGQHDVWQGSYLLDSTHYVLTVAVKKCVLDVVFQILGRHKVIFNSVEPGVAALIRMLPKTNTLQAVLCEQTTGCTLYLFQDNNWFASVELTGENIFDSRIELLNTVWVTRAFFATYPDYPLWEHCLVRLLEEVIVLENSSLSVMMAYAL